MQGRRVLITGGTGSFGSTVTRGLLDGPIGRIRIPSRDEAKQDEMRRRLQDNRVRFYVGDVRDAGSVRKPWTGVDYGFHAPRSSKSRRAKFFPLQASGHQRQQQRQRDPCRTRLRREVGGVPKQSTKPYIRSMRWV